MKLLCVAALTILSCSVHAEQATINTQTPGPAAVDQSASDVPKTTHQALLGQSLEQAQHMNFFTFFSFSMTNDIADPAHPGMNLKIFGQNGAFKGAVTLLISTKSGSDVIVKAGLMLRRDFVDNPRTAVFARDVVKSFLELSPAIAGEKIATLHTEVWKGCIAGTTQYSANGKGGYTLAACADPARSPAYDTYLGKEDKCRISYPGGYVMLQNTNKIQGVPLLFVELGGT